MTMRPIPPDNPPPEKNFQNLKLFHYEYKVYKSQNVHKQQIQSLQVTKCTEVVQGYDTNFGLSVAFKKAVLGGIKPKM